MRRCYLILGMAVACAACAGPSASAKHKAKLAPFVEPEAPADPEPVHGHGTIVIRNATVMTAVSDIYAPGFVVLQNGHITAVGASGADAELPHGADVVDIDGTGMFLTPGIIDTHSHMGVYPIPEVKAHADGNEMTRPTTPEVWAEHAFWPQDPSLWRAVAMGGITTIQVLPGSANLIGGRSFVAKLRPATSARLMRFVGAPQGLKMACGENPKNIYGGKGGSPMTRMGNIAGFRAAFQEAAEYRRHWEKYDRDFDEWKKDTNAQDDGDDDDPPDPPDRNLGLETLSAVLDGDILVHNHCYRADELHIMLDLAREFGFKIRSFHHGLEAYKLRDRLAQENVAVSTWVDWWGYKMEAFDGIPQNAAMLAQAGVKTIIHSDSEREIRHLNQEAAKAVAAGNKVGIQTSDNEALRWITANPAWALGVDGQTGTLEVGKMADVVLWDNHPLSVYARPVRVIIDGIEVYNRAQGPRLSDFELGLLPTEVTP